MATPARQPVQVRDDINPSARVHSGSRRACSSSQWWAAALVGVVCILGVRAVPRAQESTDLAGTWALNREASEFPRELGFGASFVPVQDDASGGGRRGGRRGGGSNSGLTPTLRPQGESYDEGRRRELLTEEVRTPPSRLTITDTPDTVTFTDDKGQSRAFHPNGRAETIQVDGVPVLTTARRENGKLIVLYAVADLRQLRYTYSRSPSTRHLEIGIEFLERGTGDTVHLVYAPPPPPAPAPTATGAAAAGSGGERTGAPPTGAPAMPRAGSEFTGLTRIGIVVEELSSQSSGCGLKRDELETAVAKPFTDVGIRAVRNGDEDTYLYVNIMTSTMTSGMCISRWDWSINSTTDATLSYQKRPLLAQVLLAKKGGLSGSMPATHGGDVMRGMIDGLTQIAAMIRDANK